jgi:hypothetical protein
MYELGMAERLWRVIAYVQRCRDETWTGANIDPEIRPNGEPLEVTLNILNEWAGRYAELAANETMTPRDDAEEDAYREVHFSAGRDARREAIVNSTEEERGIGFIQFKFRGRLWSIYWIAPEDQASGEGCWSDPELNPFKIPEPIVG